MDKTKIEWASATLNPIRAAHDGKIGFHCIRVSPGCEHCYAETMNVRALPNAGTGLRYVGTSEAATYLDTDVLFKAERWERPRRIFWCSMTDLFGPWVTTKMLDRIHATMAISKHHTHMVLTKRSEAMRDYLNDPLSLERVRTAADLAFGEPAGAEWPLANVQYGVSIESQDYFGRIVDLFRTEAAVRFISAEPLLGPLDLKLKKYRLDGVIVGGESGSGARPMFPAWARNLRDQCLQGKTPFFFKQWGSWLPVDPVIAAVEGRMGTVKTFSNGQFSGFFDLVGKAGAGRALDGVEWDQLPGEPI